MERFYWPINYYQPGTKTLLLLPPHAYSVTMFCKLKKGKLLLCPYNFTLNDHNIRNNPYLPKFFLNMLINDEKYNN